MLRINCILRSAAAMAGLLCLGTAATAEIVLVDFGRHNNGTDGTATTSPDVNGNYWNNFSENGDFEVPLGFARNDLLATDNTATAIDFQTTTRFRSNGRQNGGLLSPDPALLGDFAIGTATEDYWFTENGLGGTGSMVFSDLDPSMLYNFRLFGTRNTDAGGVRTTSYTVTGGDGPVSQDLQTSGAGSSATAGYFGNNDTIISFTGVSPDANNEITLDLTVVNGGFAYLGVLELTAVPEPGSLALGATTAGLLLLRRRKA